MDIRCIDKIWPLMEEAFPPIERRSRQAQAELFQNKKVTLRTIEQNGALQGFITWWDLPHCRFVEHLAVDPTLRGGGLGPKLLALACEGEKTVVLEAEKPDANEMAPRRLGFYRRNGFFENFYPYQQQPLNIGDPPLDLLLLSHGAPLDPEVFDLMKHELYTLVYGVSEAMV